MTQFSPFLGDTGGSSFGSQTGCFHVTARAAPGHALQNSTGNGASKRSCCSSRTCVILHPGTCLPPRHLRKKLVKRTVTVPIRGTTGSSDIKVHGGAYDAWRKIVLNSMYFLFNVVVYIDTICDLHCIKREAATQPIMCCCSPQTTVKAASQCTRVCFIRDLILDFIIA